MIPRTAIRVPARGRRPEQLLRRTPGYCMVVDLVSGAGPALVGAHLPRGPMLDVAPIRDAAAVAAAERRAALWPFDVSDPWPAVRVGYGALAPEPLTETQLEGVRRYLRSGGLAL